MTESESDDVAVVVYREDETWDVDLLPPALTEDLTGLIQVLRQQPSIGGTIGLAAVGDDFFVAIRAAVSAPAHMVQGSRVTTSVCPSSRQPPAAAAAARSATISACAVGSRCSSRWL